MAELSLAMPALLRNESITLLAPAALRGKVARVSVDGTTAETVRLAERTVVGDTGDRPDGVYGVKVNDARLEFEVIHEHFRRSREQFGRPEIIAHRGGKSDAPENTLAALRLGLERGDRCEFDARLTLDHELVVMHDPTVDRTTGGSGTVAELSLAEIRELATGEEVVPTLADALRGLGDDARFQIHVKLEDDEARNDVLLAKVAETIGAVGCESRSQLLASKPRTIDVLERNARLRLDVDVAAGPIERGFETLTSETYVRDGHRLKTSDFHLHDSGMVRAAHELGIRMVCWASDSSDASVKRLVRLGVDAVMTDHPERMGRTVERLEGETAGAGAWSGMGEGIRDESVAAEPAPTRRVSTEGQ